MRRVALLAGSSPAAPARRGTPAAAGLAALPVCHALPAVPLAAAPIAAPLAALLGGGHGAGLPGLAHPLPAAAAGVAS